MGLYVWNGVSKRSLLLRIETLETELQRARDDHKALTAKVLDLRVKVQGHEPMTAYGALVGRAGGKVPKSGMEGEMEALEAYINACIQSVRDDVRKHVESRVLHPELKERDDLESKARRFTVLAEEIQ